MTVNLNWNGCHAFFLFDNNFEDTLNETAEYFTIEKVATVLIFSSPCPPCKYPLAFTVVSERWICTMRMVKTYVWSTILSERLIPNELYIGQTCRAERYTVISLDMSVTRVLRLKYKKAHHAVRHILNDDYDCILFKWKSPLMAYYSFNATLFF